jgi:8-oxo-dGTP pyrophosphatase MutT (NUDIX family)
VDLVARVLADVAARHPIDDREAASVAEVLATVPRLAHPFDVDADPVHVTGSAFVVGRRGIVLLRHRRLGIWVQPGGHVDPGEAPWDGARREAIEETGLAVRPLGPEPELAHVDVHPGGRGHTHLDLRYLFTAGTADPDPPAGESQEVGWFAWPDAATVAEPALGPILAALAARFG